MSIHVQSKLYRAFTFLGVLLVALAQFQSIVSAHDIPNDVTVHAFLKPEGQRVRLLIRVPMVAMRDIPYSKNPDGYVDLQKIEEPLRTATKTWLSDNIELYEGETRLAEPAIVATRAVIQS